MTLWNTDTIKTLEGKLLGRSPMGYHNWEYELPYSGIKITLLNNERWMAVEPHTGKEVEGVGKEELWKYAYPIEQAIKLEREKQAEIKIQVRYQVWEKRAEKLVELLNEDQKKWGGECKYELVRLKESWRKFADLKLTEDGRMIGWWNFNQETGECDGGALEGKAFTGWISFKKVVMNRYQIEWPK